MSARKGPVKVALVNDYEVVVAGLRAMLQPYPSHVLVVETDVRTDPDHNVDVALFDVYGQPGLGITRIKEMADDTNVGAVAVYTWSLTPSGRSAALEAGARGIIAKTLPADGLVEAVCQVAAGQKVETGGFRGGGLQHGAFPGAGWNLTARESEVLALLTSGMSNAAMAESLYVSENTVRTHLKGIFRKLEVTNRSQALAKALGDPSFAVLPVN